jgi:hypothetical protein
MRGFKVLGFAGLMMGVLIAVTGCASTKSITSEQLAPTLAGIPAMPVYYRTPMDKILEIDHLAYLHKRHPLLTEYPFLRVEYLDKCVDSTYNPTGLLVSAVTFPLAVVGHAGWTASGGSSTCNGYETNLRLSVCESAKSEINYEMPCRGDLALAAECKKFADAATEKWNKGAKIISVIGDKETADIVNEAKMTRIRELVRGAR